LGAVAAYETWRVREANHEVRQVLVLENASTERQSFTASGLDVLIPGQFTMSPFEVRDFRISISDTMQNAKIVGTFNASGGFYNDIEVYVIDEVPPAASGNARLGRAFYHSGKVTSGTVDTILAPGEHHLVFSNLFSKFDKSITTNITVQFQSQ
jgi:hypothetical protein